ncbi:Predicted dehydrogenase [Actinacidiphila yanglinensis]|uniref:Predicted dehydrogenase n=1 Tax=Actinacidiphila yanglinensis TaxID=310779 RepID=A0A1H6C3X2_9ACTN|nr:Gfo/Idh/MocA family oxidoreductase [Actinacidiphila yanglinensis]SEG67669.1 Predicted dehydrogenase [Actinacidiphila yanglinensis]
MNGSSPTPTRVALVGCGAMGEIVARDVYPAAVRGGPVELVAVVDPDDARAAAAARYTGARNHRTLADALAQEDIDAVDIRVPHHLHAALAREAIGHGRHVLIEKPIATTVADAASMVDAAKSAGVVLAVAENYPHLKAVRDARRLLAEGRLGRALAIQGTRAYRIDGVWVRDGWRKSDGPAGGILLDQGTHQVSLIRQLGGPVTAVSAAGSLDTVTLTLRLDSGLVAQSLITWHSPGPWDQAEASVIAEGGRLDVVVDYEGHTGGCVTWTPGGTDRQGAENYYDSHRLIVEDWIDAVRNGTGSRVPGAEGLEDLAVVAAAAESLDHDGAFIPVGRR